MKVEFAKSIAPEVETQLTSLRERKGLTIVAPEKEGAPLATLPDNLFGFTFSPVNESTPLFAKRQYQSFEVHKLTGGVVHLLGFLTEKEAAIFFEGKEPMDCQLFPEPHEESKRLVEVPLERIAKAKALSRSGGNFMPVTLDPA
jgi:hypothetical protein